MDDVEVADRESVLTAVDAVTSAMAALAHVAWDQLTHTELVAVLDKLETATRQQPTIAHRIITRLVAETSPTALGATSWPEVLAARLRISKTEGRRRLRHAELLGQPRALSGEPLPPRLPHTAAGQARGAIGAEQIRVIETFFDQLPAAVDAPTRESAEATLADLAVKVGPVQLRHAADRLAYLLNQDGPCPSDADRARRRCLTIGRQQADGMSEVSGWLDPQARATLDAVLAKLAAPGMCNPDDEVPQLDGQPGTVAIERDTRSPAQRNHDALTALGRLALTSGRLGHHNGLPVTIIVSTTLHDLESGTGQAVTGAGTLLPMADTIRLAAHAHHYLAVFDHHTQMPLYLGRSQRCASPGQRIVLHGQDRGCTFPGCTAPGYLCQAHHIDDWSRGGPTDVDNLTFACGPHNRLVENTGWTTRKRHDGTTEWLAPAHLDPGGDRVNHYHHPDRYLLGHRTNDP